MRPFAKTALLLIALALLLASPSNAEFTRLVHRPGDGPGDAIYPRVSPDGSHLAFCADFNEENVYDIYIMDLPDGDPHLLAHGGKHPSWSPDGHLIAYDHNGDINVVKAVGGEPRTLLSGVVYAFPVFTADGNKLIFSSDHRKEPKLWSMPLAGGMPRRLIDDETPQTYPTCSPDGRTVVFSRGSDGERDLWRYDFETGEMDQLTSFQGDEQHPCFSDTGSYLTFWIDPIGSGLRSEPMCLAWQSREIVALPGPLGPKRHPCFGAADSVLYFSAFRAGPWEIWSADSIQKEIMRLLTLSDDAILAAGNYPSPYSHNHHISCRLHRAHEVSYHILSIDGVELKCIGSEFMAPGEFSFTFSPGDYADLELKSSIYIIEARAGSALGRRTFHVMK